MSSVSQAILSSWFFDPKITLGCALALLLYFRGWLILHRTLPDRFPVWRLLAFVGGLATVWLAIASPLDAFSGMLLSAHMVQHLLLLSVAAPLILLGSPLLPVLRGLPRKFTRDGVGPFLTWPALKQVGHKVTNPLNCWLLMAVTLCAWHVPAAFDLALRSPAWHKVEHVCFLLERVASAVNARLRSFARYGDLAASEAMPRGNAVTPPELAGDAPVVDVAHPLEVRLGILLGRELDMPKFNCGNRLVG